MTTPTPASGNEPHPDELAVRYLDGVASESEVAALDARLRGDGDARRAFVQLSHLHALIAEIAREPLVAAPQRRSWLWPTAVAAAAAVLATATWWATAGPAPREATVVAMHGEVVRDHASAAAPVMVGQRVAAHDRLVVGAASSLDLAWSDGTRVTIESGSTVVLAEPPGATLRLDQGGVRASVVAHDPKHPFAIATPDAVATDIGTVFVVRRDAAGTRVEVVAGTVGLAAAGAIVQIPAGRQGVAVPGQAPQLVAPAAPAPAPKPASRPPELPSSAVAWREPLPAGSGRAPLPDGLVGAPWRVDPVDRVSVAVSGRPLLPVVRRGAPKEILGEASHPSDLREYEHVLRGVETIVFVDAAAGRAWEVRGIEPIASGRIVAKSMTPLAVDAVDAMPALGGLLTPFDLEHGAKHGLAVAVPRQLIDSGRLAIGDRIALGDDHAAAVDHAGEVLAAALSRNGAWVVASEAIPTLLVDPRIAGSTREQLSAAMRRFAPSLRLVSAVPEPPRGDF